jgi:hypothetical protein
MTLSEFLAVYTKNDPVAGRALNTTTDGGVDSLDDLLTKSDPAGGRAIKISISGGVTKFWTEAQGGTQTTSSWTAIGAATNINAAIVPKGTGAIVAAIPDGTAVGGNARGTYAVDLQLVRSNQEKIASGPYSVITGGRSNRIHPQAPFYGEYCVISGGNANDIVGGSGSFIGAGGSNSTGGGNNSVIVGGSTNTLSGSSNSAIVGGLSNTASGSQSFIGGGYLSTASGSNATVGGGYQNSASNTGSGVAAGRQNTASGQYSFVGGGISNQATFTYDTICGGDSNSLTGTNNSQNRFIGGGAQNGINAEQTNGSLIVGGLSNKIYRGAGSFIVGGGWGNGGVPNMVAATSSGILGGAKNNIGRTSPALYPTGSLIGIGEANKILSDASTIVNASFSQVDEGKHYGYIENGQYVNTTLHGQKARNSGSFANVLGDNQVHELIWRREVTGTAQTELFLDGASIAAILPGTNSVWNGIIDITSICTTTGDGTTVVGHVSATAYKVTIKRIGTTTSLVGGVQEIGITNADASMSTAVFTIDNNDTNESLRVRFTPPSTAGSTTVIRAVATFRGTQIKY